MRTVCARWSSWRGRWARAPRSSEAAPREVDFLWRDHRLIVETDSFLYHRGSVSFEDDYARDLDLRSAGYTVLRFNETQIAGKPERVAADLNWPR